MEETTRIFVFIRFTHATKLVRKMVEIHTTDEHAAAAIIGLSVIGSEKVNGSAIRYRLGGGAIDGFNTWYLEEETAAHNP